MRRLFLFFKGHLLRGRLHPKFPLRGGPVLVHSGPLICVVWPEEGLRVTGGVAVMAGYGRGRVVRVSPDNADCALRGRSFVCVGLNMRRLVRGDSACCWGVRGLGRVR